MSIALNKDAFNLTIQALTVVAGIALFAGIAVWYLGVEYPHQTTQYRELSANIKKWEQARIREYEFDAEIVCYCDPIVRSFRVRVAGDRFAVTNLDTGSEF